AGVTENTTGTPAVVELGVALNTDKPNTLTVTVAFPDGTGAPVPAVAVTSAVTVVVNVAVATPFASLVAVDGETDPFVVEKVTGKSVITVPVGARSGTLSHAATRANGSSRRNSMERRCVTISGANNSSLMSLRGQGSRVRPRCFANRGSDGYAMAALLVAMAV